jgi:hypothetical protein
MKYRPLHRPPHPAFVVAFAMTQPLDCPVGLQRAQPDLLEMVEGFVDEHKFKVGQTVSF